MHHGGLLLVVLGVVIPWVRIGGRNRSGLGFAAWLFGLEESVFGPLPDVLGLLWYSIPFVALVLFVEAWRFLPPVPGLVSLVGALWLVAISAICAVAVVLAPLAGSHVGAVVSLVGSLIVASGSLAAKAMRSS